MRATQRLFLSIVFFYLITVSVLAQAQTALQFVPIAPCRAADTRLSGGPITGGTSRPFSITGSDCNVPATAQAFALNVTVVPHGPLYVVTVWPTGQDLPNSSLMNSYDGRVKANAAIVPAGTPNQEISVFVSNTSDVVLDVDGYFIPATDSALAFYPLSPCRVEDTRKDGRYLQAGQPSTFNVLGAATCHIPPSAAAYSLNFTVVPRSDAVWVFTAWPTGSNLPTSSTLNDPTGTVVANAALIQSGTNGEIDALASADTDLVIDINGYFAPPGQNGTALYTSNTCRVLDTRPPGGAGAFDGTLVVDVLGSQCQPPPTATAYVLNATVVPQGPVWLLTLWPDGEPQPNYSNLNAWDGAVTSNMAIVPTQNGKVDAATAGLTNLILDMASYFAPLPSLAITTTTLPDGTTGQPYSQQLAASGGEPPYSWVITNGSLPDGLSLGTTGLISGTPTTAGVFHFTVKVTDQLANSASANLTITVQSGPLAVTTTSLPDGTASVAYNATLGAAGGVPPYTWSIVTGTLPVGLSLDTNSGLISGAPSTAGVSNFTVQVKDSEATTAQAALTILINAATNNGALSGNYAFSFNGYHGSPATSVLMAGSFVADGNGSITRGVLDLNNGNGSAIQGTTFTGSYTITADGLGTMSFNAGALGVMNFHVVASKLGNGSMIQDNADPNTRGSGAFYVQTITDFTLPPSGSYAIGSSGADGAFNRYAKAGAFTLTQVGAVINGSEDDNDNGALTNRTFTGQFLPPNPQSGRGQVSFSFPNGVINTYSYYVVFNGEAILVGIDPISQLDPLTLGMIQEQAPGGFSNASLNGPSIIEVSGVSPNNGSPQADAVLGLITADGNGNTTVSIDQNQGGTLTQQVAQGTYSVAANGRVTLTGVGSNPPILYLTGVNQAFVVGQDNSAASGVIEPQTATPPYNNLSILGTYLGGTVTPVLSAIVDSVSWLFADGNGNINGIQNYSGPSGTGTQNLVATYQVDSTGRTLLNGASGAVAYVVSNKKMVVLPNGDNPAISSYAAAATN